MSFHTDSDLRAMSDLKRRDYLKDLAGNYGVPAEVVFSFASALGPNEDHDGLIVELEDYLDETMWEDC